MKTTKHLLVAAGIVATLSAIPVENASAYWLGYAPGVGSWSNAYVYDPRHRYGTPEMRQYIRDLYRYGPEYAKWRQYQRRPFNRYGWW